MTMLASTDDGPLVEVHYADWRDLLAVVAAVGGCDLLAVDAPYSAKTHAGQPKQVGNFDGSERADLIYGHWTPDDARAFVEAWHPLCRGWFVSITDDQLAPAWSAALEAVGRYVFAWLPYVAPGSRVRMLGDGPSSWTNWIVVARPRTVEFSRWGTLPGAYVLPEGHGGAMPITGGKPAWLAQRLVEDYSRVGDLVVDPTCGAGTTAIGAIRSGRRAIVGDADPAHAAIAAEWIMRPHGKAPTLGNPTEHAGQLPLLG